MWLCRTPAISPISWPSDRDLTNEALGISCERAEDVLTTTKELVSVGNALRILSRIPLPPA